MKDKTLIKNYNTQRHSYRLSLAMCFNLFEFLPHVTYGNQKNQFSYGGVHKFIEIGWLIFHAKLKWKSYKIKEEK